MFRAGSLPYMGVEPILQSFLAGIRIIFVSKDCIIGS